MALWDTVKMDFAQMNVSDDEVPLPEDMELRCFEPIEKAHR